MNIENIVTVKIDLSNAYTIKYSLILLENSKITTDKLIELFKQFYSLSPESFTFIFDFSSDVSKFVGFTSTLDYIERYGYPEWSYRVCNPIYAGNLDYNKTVKGKLELCKKIVEGAFGQDIDKFQVESIWCEM